MTVTPDTTAESAPEPAATRNEVWHGLTADEAARDSASTRASGLDAAEVEQRRAQVRAEQARGGAEGARLARVPAPVPRPHAVVLLGAAIVSIVALQEFSTGLAILGLTVLNAVLGLNQEGKAAESVAALQKMLLIRAHVRRGGAACRHPGRGARSGGHRLLRGGRQDPGGRAAARGRDARDRGGGAHRREHAGAEVGRAGAGRRRAARRPRRHGLHELDGHARARRDGRDRRPGWRPRSGRSPGC